MGSNWAEFHYQLDTARLADCRRPEPAWNIAELAYVSQPAGYHGPGKLNIVAVHSVSRTSKRPAQAATT